MVTLLALLGCTIVLMDVPCDTGHPANTVDDTAVDCPELYPDADGDGYGEEAGATRTCETSGWAAVSGDCDDADPDVFPEAPERCNGVSDACDPSWTSDDGLATWTTDSGWEDVTADFAAGTAGSPASLAYVGGQVDVCGGEWFATVSLDGVRLIGHDDVTIDAGSAGSVLTVNGLGNGVSGVTLRGGSSAGGGGIRLETGDLLVESCVVVDNVATDAAGVGVAAGASVEIRDTLIADNTADRYGGGLLAAGEIVLVDVRVTGNQALSGGGLAFAGGTAELDTTELSANLADDEGGAVYAIPSFPAALSVVDSAISGNDAAITGGVSGSDLALTCVGSTDSDRLGVFGNTSDESKPHQVTLAGDGSANATDCDLADPSTGEDGLLSLEDGQVFQYGADADFVCTSAGCE